MNASQNTNDWFWRGLYVPATGRLGQLGYLGVLIRCAIIFAIANPLLATFSPALMTTFNSVGTDGPPLNMPLARIGALLIVGWPLLSAFLRRRNDFRPDVAQRFQVWILGFPVLMAALFVIDVAQAFGVQLPIEPSFHSTLQTLFYAMLIGAALVPGGEKTAEITRAKKTIAPAPVQEPPLSASQRAAMEIIAAQLLRKPSQAVRPAARSRSAMSASFPTVIERGRKLPEQGRVKPGWFS